MILDYYVFFQVFSKYLHEHSQILVWELVNRVHLCRRLASLAVVWCRCVTVEIQDKPVIIQTICTQSWLCYCCILANADATSCLQLLLNMYFIAHVILYYKIMNTSMPITKFACAWEPFKKESWSRFWDFRDFKQDK